MNPMPGLESSSSPTSRLIIYIFSFSNAKLSISHVSKIYINMANPDLSSFGDIDRSMIFPFLGSDSLLFSEWPIGPLPYHFIQ
jgi:hypothetical protein